MKPFPDAFARGVRERRAPRAHDDDRRRRDHRYSASESLGDLDLPVEPLSNRDFPGSKVWRFIEMTFHLRRAETAEGDFRHPKVVC